MSVTRFDNFGLHMISQQEAFNQMSDKMKRHYSANKADLKARKPFAPGERAQVHMVSLPKILQFPLMHNFCGR